MSKKETMAGLKALAKKAHDRGDVVMREQYSNNWRELASDAEAARAPQYLSWSTRQGGWQR